MRRTGGGPASDELKVVNILADGGPSLKRVRARAQGRAYRILKRTTHLTVILGDMPAPVARAAPQRRRSEGGKAGRRAQGADRARAGRRGSRSRHADIRRKSRRA